jgi:hypothetical protein
MNDTNDQVDSLTLKWGTLKAWDLKTDAALNALKEYFASGQNSASAMLHRDSMEQKEALCKLVDHVSGEIWNDWEDTIMTKEAAKKYVMEYK